MKQLVLFVVLCLNVSFCHAETPENLQAISVTVKAGDGQGSGVILTRKVGEDYISFVWTAGHVIEGLRRTHEKVVDGSTRTIVQYIDPQVVQEVQESGRRVGEVKYDAKVIKISDSTYGEDLAVLMIRKRNAYTDKISVVFQEGNSYVPPIGMKLVHVGSLLGQFGANSYTNGILSQTGKTLPVDGDGANMQTFDQVTVTAFPGSSGGGVFSEQTGKYIGMLVRGTSESQGFNFIVPVRRMRAWVEKVQMKWAMDQSEAMPNQKEIDEISVED